MTGAEIIGELLLEDDALTALVLPASIKAGRLPDGTELPALLVRTVSSVEWQPLKQGFSIRTTDRISVAVRATSYRQQGLVMKLVRKCCAGRTGDIGGGTRVSILTAGKGPDVNGPADTFEQTQDFRVSYDAPV